MHSLALFREFPYDLNSGDSCVYTNYLKRKVPNIIEGEGLKVSAGKRRKTCGTILPFLFKPSKNMSYPGVFVPKVPKSSVDTNEASRG